MSPTIEFIGWSFPTAGQAHRAWEQAERALSRVGLGDAERGASLWNLSDPERTEHHVVGMDLSGEGRLRAVCATVAMLRRAEAWDVPAELRDMLVRRRLRTTLEHAGEIVSGEVVHQRETYGDQGLPAGGMFLHSDGSMQPFPEPKGQG